MQIQIRRLIRSHVIWISTQRAYGAKMTSYQRQCNVSTSSRRINVNTMSFLHQVPAGYCLQIHILGLLRLYMFKHKELQKGEQETSTEHSWGEGGCKTFISSTETNLCLKAIKSEPWVLFVSFLSLVVT